MDKINLILAPAAFELDPADEPFVRFVAPSPLKKVLLVFSEADSGIKLPADKAPPLVRVDATDVETITAISKRSVLRDGVVVVHPDPIGLPDPGWNGAVRLSPLQAVTPADLSAKLRAQGAALSKATAPYVPSYPAKQEAAAAADRLARPNPKPAGGGDDEDDLFD